ncbi:dimethyl sulfoxide reductase anchor subunit family protein [Gilliamella intestini]|uniref:Anaerobic dimethyl sulfoxide reductase subunit C (DMSO reductase anchor subunit) n=1 Tax=Gilliamella intestini TaxID=1798183 RepID=A0A1C4CGP0_9GAMM|nr:DmsC/YnfH family molybdoenzyme membrane anchor subunit [Gilliamella intestini]SCC18327.1 anaerobic dimethyl sulfoxide reductase subunit C (DMSO reductase anchor subunit) [Gilliamella intestini]
MHELPLVFFTVFGQLSAGMVWLGGGFYLVNRDPNRSIIIQKINITALVFMTIGMAIASFHLGKPLRALNVIFGIGRSPMSNEIFTFGVLFGVTFAWVLINYYVLHPNTNKLKIIKKICLQLKQIPHLDQILATLLIIISLFFVWTIVLTYMLPTVKTWNTYYTAIQMYTAMLALGGVAIALLGLPRLGYMACMTGSLFIILLKIPYAHLMTTIAPELTHQQYSWMITECILLIVSLILMTINIWQKRNATMIYSLAFIGIFIGEISGRIAFYNLWTIPM